MPVGDQGLSSVNKCISVRKYSQPSEGQASSVLKYYSCDHSQSRQDASCQMTCVPKTCMNFTCERPENITMLRGDALADAGEHTFTTFWT